MMTDRTSADDRVRELYREHGSITPDIVIEDAKNKDSPLHEMFDWDVQNAAMARWRDTARRIIRSVRITISVESISFNSRGQREFMENPSKPKMEQGYITKAELRSDRDRALAAIAAEIDRAEACLIRARTIAEELGLDAEVRFVRSVIASLKNKVNAA